MATKIDYKVCVSCVMDTSDPNISFDSNGVCDYCLNFETNIKPNWHTDIEGDIVSVVYSTILDLWQFRFSLIL